MTGITIKSSMYHLHIYMKDMVAFEAILHSLNDEKHCYIEVFKWNRHKKHWYIPLYNGIDILVHTFQCQFGQFTVTFCLILIQQVQKKIVKRKQNGLGKGGHLCILSTEDSCSLAHKFLY